jgi:5'(3')-deoxyribonucleotidase
LEPQPWIHTLYNMCKQYGKVIICTSPSMNPSCAEQKIRWLRRIFGPYFHNYMIGSNKSLMSRKGNVLIDDYESNVTRFVTSGEGTAILFPMKTNANYSLASNPVEFTQQMLEKYLASSRA